MHRNSGTVDQVSLLIETVSNVRRAAPRSPWRGSMNSALTCLVATAIGLCAGTAAADFVPGIVNDRSIIHDGELRYFDVHAPPAYDGTTPTALVIDVHGLSSNKTDQRDLISGFKAVADTEGFLVAYPLGLHGSPGIEDPNPPGGGPVGTLLGPSFNAGDLCCGDAFLNDDDDEGFIQQLVVAMAKEGNIDTSRVYITGLSNGGAMTQTLACTGGHFISAFAPVAFPGAFSPQSSCVPVRPIPIITTQSTSDTIVPYAGGHIDGLVSNPIVASAQDTFNFWRDTNGCVGATPDESESLGGSMCERYTNCTDGADVELCSVDGILTPPLLGHIPYFNNDSVDVAQRSWDFMSQHTLPPANIAGSWQVNFTCSGGEFERTSFATVTHAPGSGTFSYPPGAPCGSGQIGDQVVPIASCGGSPIPFVGSMTGTALSVPTSGFVMVDTDYESPVVYPPFCGTTPMVRADAEARNEGIVTKFNGSTATRVEGDTYIGVINYYDEFDTVCFTADLTFSAPPCTFYMLRNDVAPGSSVQVEPIDGGVITFDTIVTSGTVEVTQTTVGSVALPPGFEIAGAGVYFTIETDATFSGDVEVCLPYDDVDNDGFVDGTSTLELTLVMFRDGVAPVSQSVDVALNRVCGTVAGFSEFALATSSPSAAPGLGVVGGAILIAALVGVGIITVRRIGVSASV